MGIDLSFLGIAFQCVLFILFLIRAHQGVRDYIVPLLRQTQQDTNEKWFALQERHAILIARKKQLATQFLQQEKQISLLTAKLETWYKKWQGKQEAQKAFFEEQARKIAAHRTAQEHTVVQRRTAAAVSSRILANVSQTLKKQAPSLQKEYLEHSLEHIERMHNKEQS